MISPHETEPWTMPQWQGALQVAMDVNVWYGVGLGLVKDGL